MPRLSAGAKTLSGYRKTVSPTTSEAATISPNMSGGAVGGVRIASGPERRDNGSIAVSTTSRAATERDVPLRISDVCLVFTPTHSSATRTDTVTAVNRRTAGSIRTWLNKLCDGGKRAFMHYHFHVIIS